MIVAGAAWGQSEEEVTAAVGPQLDAYTACLKRNAHRLANSGDDATVISSAISACDDERGALLRQLQEPPLGASASDAAAAVRQLDEGLRAQMTETIHKARS
jgi:hypothetical protein